MGNKMENGALHKYASFKARLIGILISHTIKEARLDVFINLKTKIFDAEEKRCVDKDMIASIEAEGKSVLFNNTIQKHILKIILEKLKSKYPESLLFRFYYILHLFETLKLLQLSTIEIISSIKIPKSFVMDFNFYRLRKLISVHLREMDREGSKGMGCLDIEGIISLEKSYYHLEDRIYHYAIDYSGFLDEILVEEPQLKSIKKLHLRLIECEKDINDTYKIIQRSPRAISLYIKFLRIYRFDRNVTERLGKKLKLFMDLASNIVNEEGGKKDPSLIFNSKTTLFQVGAYLDNIGKILDANNGASLLTGYSKSELASMNIRQVLPNIISVNHDIYMMSAYNTGMNQVLYKERTGFIKHKLGHLIHVYLLVKPLFEITKNSFKYISYLQPTQEVDNFIVTDSMGRVDSFTYPMGRILGLNPIHSSVSNMYIFYLFPNLMPFFMEKHFEYDEEEIDIDEIMNMSYHLKNINKDLNGFFTGSMRSYNNYNSFVDINPYDKKLVDNKK